VPESYHRVVRRGHAGGIAGNNLGLGAVGHGSSSTSQKHRASGGFRPSGQDVAKIVDGDQFQSAGGYSGGHVIDGMCSLTVNLDVGTC